MIFFLKKCSSDAGLDPEHLEKIAGRSDSINPLGVSRAIQVELIALEGRNIFKRARIRRDEPKLETMQRSFVEPKIHLRGRDVPNREHPLGGGKRKRLQQDSIHNRENSNARAHSEGEDSHG